MKKIFILSLFLSIFSFVQAQEKPSQDSSQIPMIVETACGQCKFKLPGKSCDLAVRINGKAYFVDGTSIDEHGDAHAKDGFCNAIRKAKVKGEVVNDRFKVTYFKLLQEKKN